MAIRVARAQWRGNLPEGKGTVRTETGNFEGPYTFGSRFEEAEGTNPEELIGAAHAACFSMAFANGLAQAGHDPRSVETTAKVHLEKGDAGFRITRIQLVCQADVPGVSPEEFQAKAEEAKTGCPISQALSATPIELDARLTSS